MQKYSRGPVWGSRILSFVIDFMSIVTLSAIIVCDP